MARTKMIKEVEVKVSPAFDKAINGVKTPKKAKPATKKAKPKAKAKAPAKPKAIRTKSKWPRGYDVVEVNRELIIDGTKQLYTVYEVSGKKLDRPRIFVSEEYIAKFIDTIEGNVAASKALSGKGFQHVKGVISAHKDMLEASLLPELDTETPEKCDKTSIEDVDA
jgi:hypothetical protein